MHYIAEYDNKNYICLEHGDNYSSYCQTCDKNLCIECECNHSKHNIIYFGKILPNKDNLNNILNELRNNIDKLKSELVNIIERMNLLIINVDNYYKLVKDIYDSLKIKKKNYEILFNIYNTNNNEFINDIQNIINDNNIQNKLIKINIIHDKMLNIYTNNNNNFNNFNSNNNISFIKDFNPEEDTISRLQREYNELKNGIDVGLFFMSSGKITLFNNNIFEWIFSIEGPDNSPYYGGKFYLKIIFPRNYPEKNPEVIFITPFYHLNVNPMHSQYEALGHVCTAILNFWMPKIPIKDVIKDIFFFFFMQNPDSPYGLFRVAMYKENRQKFNERIKYFTKKYADPSLPYKEYDSWDFSYPDE